MGEPLAVIITIEARDGRDEAAALDHGFKELKGALGVLNHSSPWAVFAVAEGEDEYFDENVDSVGADTAVEDALETDETATVEEVVVDESAGEAEGDDEPDEEDADS